MTKSFHSGRAAQSGVYAALLAELGYTGISDVLDGAYGTFFSAFVADWSADMLTHDLGSDWKILRVGFKPAPASNGSITAMTAIDGIMREHRLQADQIERITVFVSENTMHHCGWPYVPERIQSVLSAQMNLRYGVAVMALDRQAGIEQFDEGRIRDPAILKFIERIHVQHDAKFDKDGGRFPNSCVEVGRGERAAYCGHGEGPGAGVVVRPLVTSPVDIIAPERWLRPPSVVVPPGRGVTRRGSRS